MAGKHGKHGKLNIANRFSGRILALVLAFALALPIVLPVITGTAEVEEAVAGRTLRLASAKALAIANSEKIEAYELQIDAKYAARESSLRSLREKERNMKTFRWTPLLDFNFPTNPDEAEAFEFAYKPTQLQYEIDTIKHKIEDAKLAENEKVSGIYIDIITSIAEITFLKQRIEALEKAIKKNKARIAEGTATQAQVDQQEKKIEGYKSALASEESKCQRAKEKLGKEIGIDITVGYSFEDVFVSTSIARDNIEYLQNYAIERDQTVYEAKQAMELARLALSTNYALCKSQYSGNISMIDAYISQALDGSKINKRAFKKDYDAFLKKIDQPWQGSYKILFFKFPKEWFKGAIDGIRYVEDDPYVLYSAALEYESALKEYNGAVNELKSAIEEGYDNLMETRKGYKTSVRELKALRNQLIYDEVLNALGQLSLEEYDTELAEYESARSAVKDALSLYSKTLYEYDKTTCGGASAYFNEEAIASVTGYAGLGTPGDYGNGIDDSLSLMSPIIKKGATYSIRSIVDSEEFMLYIDIPEDFEYNVTDFELWSDGRKIGERTAKGEAIRHLRLTLEDVNSVFIRLYDGTDFIDDCAINPDVSYGPLNMTVGYETPDTPSEKIVGSYTVEENQDSEMIKLRFDFDQAGVARNFNTESAVAFYNISAERNLYLYSNELVPAADPFNYMAFVKGDLGQLSLRMFSEDGEYIGGAYFGTLSQSLYADTEITYADMQEIAARHILTERKSAELKTELDMLKDLLEAALEVNGQEADSGSVSYYKKRIAEIETELSEVSSNITAEEINTLITNEKAIVDSKVEELENENAPKDDDEIEKSEEELKARNAIIKNQAVEFILAGKKQAQIDSIQNLIDEDYKKIYELKHKIEGLGSTRLDETLKADYQKQIDDLEKEIEAARVKLEAAKAAELSKSDVTDEEIDRALLENGAAIYAGATDKLSDAMLYGSEYGQWATAYLENQGLEFSEENLRLVVAEADNFDKYENTLARKDILKGELEEAKKKRDKIKAEGGTANETLAAELDKIIKAYGNELTAIEKQLKKLDPAKEVRLKEYRAEKAELEARKAENLKNISGLLATKTSCYDYTGKATAELVAAQTKRNAVEAKLLRTKQTLERNIEGSETSLKEFIDFYKSKLDEKQRELDEYIHESESNEYVYKNYYLKKDRPLSIIKRIIYNNIVTIADEIEEIKSKLDKAQVDYDALFGEGAAKTDFAKQVVKWKEELEAAREQYEKDIAPLNTLVAEKEAAQKKLKDEWDASYEKKLAYENDNKKINERITELDNLINEYY